MHPARTSSRPRNPPSRFLAEPASSALDLSDRSQTRHIATADPTPRNLRPLLDSGDSVARPPPVEARGKTKTKARPQLPAPKKRAGEQTTLQRKKVNLAILTMRNRKGLLKNKFSVIQQKLEIEKEEHGDRPSRLQQLRALFEKKHPAPAPVHSLSPSASPSASASGGSPKPDTASTGRSAPIVIEKEFTLAHPSLPTIFSKNNLDHSSGAAPPSSRRERTVRADNFARQRMFLRRSSRGFSSVSRVDTASSRSPKQSRRTSRQLMTSFMHSFNWILDRADPATASEEEEQDVEGDGEEFEPSFGTGAGAGSLFLTEPVPSETTRSSIWRQERSSIDSKASGLRNLE